ncbi:hypothetical protein Poli38472_003076 [Pythium oligandrum]|uniref:non-specific serine/threonine protein kinase n=1 Tax=Pythium oligandrum TaxID=41045 RepID=A0A8K1FCG0_PYTOL|nr:hypothetical protein Poli38472_003076 [Pythium oligandrum]|eukprot:TMW57151.1 hypothetical protein Poli38472_003076 [Pythium oligandrum]
MTEPCLENDGAADTREIQLDLDSSAPSTPPLSPTVGPHNFEKLRILGAGSTGRVYLVRSVGLGPETYYAMKVIKKSELVKRNRMHRILTERRILVMTNHPFIVTLHYSFETVDYFYLVMQYCAGGELFSILKRQPGQRLSEDNARLYAAEVLVALEYLHLHDVIYRDLKPENILVHESGHIMLSDFDLAHQVEVPSEIPKVLTSKKSKGAKPVPLPPLSPTISSTDRSVPWSTKHVRVYHVTNTIGLSRNPQPRSSRRFTTPSCLAVAGNRLAYPLVDTEAHLERAEKRTSFVGTHEYVAPEIVAEEGYIGSVDWWAFGILLFEMLFGTTPFRGATQMKTLENILDICEEVTFPPDVPVSEECKNLIRMLLDKTVERRLQNPLVMKSHPFFRNTIWPLVRHQTPPLIPTMVHFLDEKAYSHEEMVSFDDEVPFHRALANSSPRRRLTQCDPVQEKIVPGDSSGISKSNSTTDAVPTTDPTTEHSRTGGEVSTDAGAGRITQTPTKSRSLRPFGSPHDLLKSGTARAKSMIEIERQHDRRVSNTSAVMSNAHNFEYVASPQKGSHWKSHDAHRTLQAALIELDLTSDDPDDLEDDEKPSSSTISTSN